MGIERKEKIKEAVSVAKVDWAQGELRDSEAQTPLYYQKGKKRHEAEFAQGPLQLLSTFSESKDRENCIVINFII